MTSLKSALLISTFVLATVPVLSACGGGECPACNCPVCPEQAEPPPEPQAQVDCSTEEWVHMPVLIGFPTGGAELDAQNREILREVVATAQSRQDIRQVRVEGHSDSVGSEAGNMGLSQQRAENVALALVEMGVPRETLLTVGYGSSQPRAENQGGALSRQTNRRVEFSILVCRGSGG